MKKITRFITITILCVCCLFNSCRKTESNFIYHNGDILLPDYAHTDTLVVVSAKLLNECFAKCDAATDEEISDILGDGTVPIEDYQDYLQATR